MFNEPFSTGRNYKKKLTQSRIGCYFFSSRKSGGGAKSQTSSPLVKKKPAKKSQKGQKLETEAKSEGAER